MLNQKKLLFKDFILLDKIGISTYLHIRKHTINLSYEISIDFIISLS